MNTADVATALGAGLVFLLLFRILFVTLPKLRAARLPCPRCGYRLGSKAVSAGVPYYERLYGEGVRVMDGPRRYLGAMVVACGGCGTELVIGELGNLVEPFRKGPSCNG